MTHDMTSHREHEMTEEEHAVSAASEEADQRTDPGTYDGPGVWHHHFLDALREQGWTLTKGAMNPRTQALADYLHGEWPHNFNDGYQIEVATACVTFLDRMPDRDDDPVPVSREFPTTMKRLVLTAQDMADLLDGSTINAMCEDSSEIAVSAPDGFDLVWRAMMDGGA